MNDGTSGELATVEAVAETDEAALELVGLDGAVLVVLAAVNERDHLVPRRGDRTGGDGGAQGGLGRYLAADRRGQVSKGRVFRWDAAERAAILSVADETLEVAVFGPRRFRIVDGQLDAGFVEKRLSRDAVVNAHQIAVEPRNVFHARGRRAGPHGEAIVGAQRILLVPVDAHEPLIRERIAERGGTQRGVSGEIVQAQELAFLRVSPRLAAGERV